VDFELRDAGAGKGLGYFALRDFAIGEKVLVERPVINIPAIQLAMGRGSEMFGLPLITIISYLAALPESVRSAALSLHNPGDRRLTDSCQWFYQNSFVLESDDHIMRIGLFIHGSRFNHACIANCNRSYVEEHGQMVFSVCDSIATGSEMTISYCTLERYYAGPDAFRDYFMRKWEFQCSCPTCSDPVFFKRCALIKKLDEEISCLKDLKTEQQRVLELRYQLLYLISLDIATDEIGPEFPLKKKAVLLNLFNSGIVQDNDFHRKVALNSLVKYVQLCEQEYGGSRVEPLYLSKNRGFLRDPEYAMSLLKIEETEHARENAVKQSSRPKFHPQA
jgi:hypothetical protein